MDHDASWTRLFSHPLVAAELVRLALPELAVQLDFEALKPLHTRWARSQPPTESDQDRPKVRAAGAYALRTGDQAWRIWQTDNPSRSLVLPVEYQSTLDGHMGLRSLEYALLAHEMELRTNPDADGWLRVLPLVIYSGGARWARVAPPWAARRVEMTAAGEPSLAIGRTALLLDADSHGGDDSNLVALLLSLNVAPDWEAMQDGLARAAELVWDALPPERARSLIDDLMDWVSVCQPHLPANELDSARSALKREEEPKMMALARMGIEYPRRLRAEGRAEGLAHERDVLLRMAARKFEAVTAKRLETLLTGQPDATRLAELADWIIDCNTGDELVARAQGAQNGR